VLTLPKQHLDRLPVASLSRPALCWSIQPAVNFEEALRFTDHCRTLTLEDGMVYSPAGGLEGTAVSRPAGFGPSDREVRGIIDNVKVTDTLIRGGYLRDAVVTELLIDWLMPWMPPIHKVRYVIEDLVEVEPSVWEAKLGGLRTLLQPPVGGYFSPRCQVEVFSQGPGKCNLDVRGNQVTLGQNGLGFPNGEYFFEFACLWPASFVGLNKWRDGKVSWLSGSSNSGWTSYCREITQVSPGSVLIELHEPTPNPIDSADTVVIQRGCNHVSGIYSIDGDCKHFYNNLPNFQGEPTLPGREKTIKGVETTG
jgi:uncharacterized phage protein (TIGR02218 family)